MLAGQARMEASREFSVRRDIRRCWKNSKQGEHFVSAAHYLKEIENLTIDASQDWTNLPVQNWVMILDEFSFGYSMIFQGLRSTEIDPESHSTIIVNMLGALAGHMHAIRKLVLSGFDTHARILTRTLCEHIDITIAIIGDYELAMLYKKHSDPDDSNAFWHKNISRRRLRRKITDTVSIEHPEAFTAYQEIDKYFLQEEQILGVAVHPSYLSAVMISATGCATSFQNAGIFGVMDSVSTRILQLIFFRNFELIMVGHKLIDAIIAENSPYEHILNSDQARDRLRFMGTLAAYFSIYHEFLPLKYREPQTTGLEK